LGYAVKRPFTDFTGWLGGTGVEEVCSVSDCLRKRPKGWVSRWDFNGAGCYLTPEAAFATIGDEEPDRCLLYAYWLVNPGATLDDVFVYSAFPVPQVLPSSPGPDDFDVLGYDVVGSSLDELGPGHSPLSCNGQAKNERVNGYCLLDDLDRARELARRWTSDEAEVEPGAYFVVRVARRP
jgi:hypothetical protein